MGISGARSGDSGVIPGYNPLLIATHEPPRGAVHGVRDTWVDPCFGTRPLSQTKKTKGAHKISSGGLAAHCRFLWLSLVFLGFRARASGSGV